MIRFYHVTKIYKSKNYALQDITITIHPREFCFLTGPSGAGKSTFLKLALGEETPTSGQVLVTGRNLQTITHSEFPYFRRKIATVFQDFRLIPTRTVFENITILLTLQGYSQSEMRKRAFDTLRLVGLQSRMEAFPEELSGGEQQRVAIARALISKPHLLLADEPTGNLDPELAHEIMRIFQEINATGTTVVVATHDKSLITAFSGRVIVLAKGKLIDSGE
ncbi:MAG: cell division ATP-binding protein FtsE [Thermoanaerobaculaceae bacterium]|nr:cell division ATP-binding protein FtsE [Thermoanaerobaculaceae bacterium]